MVLRLAKHNPDCIFLGSRSQEKGRVAIQEIKTQVPDANIELLQLDLASLESVATAASTVQSQSGRLDLLINNGGIASVPLTMTKDGFEIQFGTNYVGHFLLTKLLLPTMLDTAKQESKVPGSVRVVNLSSDGHYHAPAPGINFDDFTCSHTWFRYAQSKLANILHAKALAKRYPTIVFTSVHPGTARTRIFDKMNSTIINVLCATLGWAIFMSVEDGAKTPLWAATAEDGVESGSYYTPIGVKSAGSAYASDEKLEERLWQWTEKALSEKGY
jgi:NAD(P)-dependent dehydrogenase (short-subunit alcohol dehydrogenase family)